MLTTLIPSNACRAVHRDTQKVWPVLAPITMHHCCLPGPYHPPERTSPTTCAGVGQHARVRQSTAAKKEGGSLVRGTEESDRPAALASAETQVRARAVLPGSGSSEHPSDWCASLVSQQHRWCRPPASRTERRKPATPCSQMKGILLRDFFNTHAWLRQLRLAPHGTAENAPSRRDALE
jgi:hypothetical protein